MSRTLDPQSVIRVIADHARDFISLHDHDGRYLYASRACATLLGYQPEEIVGTMAYEYFHPDDIPHIQKHHEENFDNPGHAPVTYRIRRKDGEYVWFESISTAIEEPDFGDVIVVVSRDVSDRVQAEKSAHHSAAAIEALAANIPNGAAYVFDRELRFLAAEGSEIRAAGFEPEEFLGKQLKDTLPADVVEAIQPAYEAALEGEPSQARVLFGDQSYLISTAPVRDEDGEIVGGISLAQNVTHLSETQRQLQESEEQFRGAFETATHGMAIVGIDGRVLRANAALAHMLGYSQEEFARLSFADFTHPADLEKDLNQVKRLLDGEIDHYTLEKRYLHKKGHVVWGMLSASIVRTVEGQPLHMIGQVIDITERKRSEVALMRASEEWERTFHAVPDLIALIDERGKVLRVNQAMADRLGRHPEELTNRSCDEILPGSDSQAFNICQQEMTTEDTTELELPSLGGWFAITTSPLVNVEGDPLGTVLVAHDITARKRVETALFERSRMEATTVLAGGFAHDINNRMSVVLGNTDLLGKLKPGDDPAPLLAKIRASARTVSRMADELIAFARMGRYNPQPILLNELVEETLTLAARILSTPVNIVTRLVAEPDRVLVDTAQLQQMMLNLLNNGVEAMHGMDQADLFVTSSVVQALPSHLGDEDEEEQIPESPGQQDPHYVLTIRDEGEGMSEETLARAREPFYTTREHGRGMGLAAVHGIVENHGGQLELDSLPGFGTTVRVYLPLLDPEPEPEPATPEATTYHVTVATESKPRDDTPSVSSDTPRNTVLIVDDEEGIREMLATLLTSLDYDVLTAENGHKALDIFEQNKDKVLLVLLDLLMPVMDGTETFHALREQRGDLPVILISGYERDEAIKNLLDEGAASFMHKPFELEQLIAEIQRVAAQS